MQYFTEDMEVRQLNPIILNLIGLLLAIVLFEIAFGNLIVISLIAIVHNIISPAYREVMDSEKKMRGNNSNN